jgi:hypothetical protein
MATGKILDGSHPYKTRRRAASVIGGAIHRTVIVEWNNVTAGRDLDIDWFQTHEHLMRTGYAGSA